MNSDLKVLIEFLRELHPDGANWHLPQAKTQEAVLLERFACGECTRAEEAEVASMLRLHPAWLRWLADRVRLAKEMAIAA